MRKRPKNIVISIDQPLKGADGDDVGGWREIADSKPQPDECFELNETLAQINHALDRLPKQFKNVIILREFYGLPYEEVALRTMTGLGTVKSRIARAKTKMQFQLERMNCA
jgi:RNA polymerase sigma-70 factor (ECF subfamily)